MRNGARALSSSLALVAALAACSPSSPADDASTGSTDAATMDATASGDDAATGSDVASQCALYCQGMFSCAMPFLAADGCTYTMSETAFRADCEAACVSAAGAMTSTQVGEAIHCLTCLHGYLEPSACSASGLMDAGTGFALTDAVAACGAGCMTDGVSTINDSVSAMLFGPGTDAGRYGCDAGP